MKPVYIIIRVPCQFINVNDQANEAIAYTAILYTRQQEMGVFTIFTRTNSCAVENRGTAARQIVMCFSHHFTHRLVKTNA